MSSTMANRKQPTPGPQSACMIRYLEGLANSVTVSQLAVQPCSSVVLSSRYSNPRKAAEPKVALLNTMDRYLVKNQSL